MNPTWRLSSAEDEDFLLAPVDFFLGAAGNRRRLLDVPLVTEAPPAPGIRWSDQLNLIFSWTIIVDLKRVFSLNSSEPPQNSAE